MGLVSRFLVPLQAELLRMDPPGASWAVHTGVEPLAGSQAGLVELLGKLPRRPRGPGLKRPMEPKPRVQEDSLWDGLFVQGDAVGRQVAGSLSWSQGL